MILSAESRHIKDIAKIAEEYFNESPYSKTHKFDKNQCLEFARNCVIKTPYEVAIAENDNGDAVGFAMGYLTEYGWCADIRVSMEFLYINPKYRSTDMVNNLVTHIEDWGRKMGAVEINVGDIGFNPQGIQAFYTNNGYSDPGVVLRKIL
jgi:hypothetical protein